MSAIASRDQSPALSIGKVTADCIEVRTCYTKYSLLPRTTALDTPGGKNLFRTTGNRIERTPILASFYGSNIIVDVPPGFTLDNLDVIGDGNHPALQLTYHGQLNGQAATYVVEVRFYNESRTCI